MSKKIFRKEITFEGYYNSCWETSYLSKYYEVPEKMQKWFKDELKQLIKEKPSKNFVFFQDMIPKGVYEILAKNPKTKFHFKIIVEAKLTN